MEIVKENWKMVLFIILAIFILIKLDEISSNGRYIVVGEGMRLLDTRNGKIYKPVKEKDNLFNWELVFKEVK
jgi:hypothetical protein